MATEQDIPSTRLAGSHVFAFDPTTEEMTAAQIVIDRTVNQGLNAAGGSQVAVGIDYSLDGGTTWQGIAAVIFRGGPIVAKGIPLTQDTLQVGIGRPFPVGTLFRVNTAVVNGSPVRITGSFRCS